MVAGARLEAKVELPDVEVVRRVVAGEVGLFEVLLRRHNQRLYRAIRSLLRDEAECEDALQQAWISAYSHLGQFQGTAALTTWLTRIALNEARSRVGARAHLRPVDDVSEEGDAMREPGKDPEAHAADRELGRLVEAAVDELPEHFRAVFVLRQVEGLSTADAAAALEVSEEVVKTRLHRAHLVLRERLLARVVGTVPAAFPFMGRRCDRVVAAVMARLPGLPAA